MSANHENEKPKNDRIPNGKESELKKKEKKVVSPLEHAVYVKGNVVKGKQIGSKVLQIPTANLPVSSDFSKKYPHLHNGVYVGWSNVKDGPVYKAVISVGDNPTFGNDYKTIESHLLHEFEEDFYDEQLKVVIIGFIRFMEKYDSLDDLRKAMKNDISIGHEVLDKEPFLSFKQDPFFKPQ